MYANLVKLRKEKGMTQGQMAVKVDCGKMAYNRKERGTANFNIKEMMIIQKIFDKPLDYIFFDN